VHASVVIEERDDRLRLGHYSSGDGLSGLILDRTTEGAARARLDGSTTVIDLAIVRSSERRALLISADGTLTLEIDDRGGVRRYEGEREVRLFRDGDAEPLPAAATPAVDAARLGALEGRARAACGAGVRFELGAKVTAPQQRGVSHVLERAARALESVCRDRAGKDAVAKKVRTVRLTVAPRAKTAFEGGVLVVEGTFEGEELGPTAHELRVVLERGL